jgi:hypothetical protein
MEIMTAENRSPKMRKWETSRTKTNDSTGQNFKHATTEET